MPSTTERTTLIVHRLNHDALNDIVAEVIMAQYAPNREPRICVEPLVYAYLPGAFDGGIARERLAIICQEGVGWVPDDRDLYPIHYDFGDGAGYQGMVRVGAGRVEREALTEEEVDLADFIRRFGERLEGNFWTWYERLTGEPQ